jgi:CRISPR system Cascade subunit CasB
VSDGDNSLIAHLMTLQKNKDRGALAALRKGLGKEPGTVPEMFEHVVSYVPRGASKEREDAYFLVASLFASYPDGCGHGDMGATFRAICTSVNSDSIEKRFVSLLKSHREELPEHLRHAIALAKSKDAPMDWDQLLNDLQYWDDASGSVQRRWARSFWYVRADGDADQKSEE